MIKAYLHCCFDEEDSFEDELDHYVVAKLAYLKSLRYVFCSPYQTWNSNWEWMLYDDAYMTDTEFLANFRMDRACILQLNSLVEDDEAFSNYEGSRNKQLSMLHVMVFLKYLGSYGNEASLEKIGHAMGISKGAVMQACSAILKLQKMLGIDKRAVSRNERSNENAKKAPAEENRTLIFDMGMKEKWD